MFEHWVDIEDERASQFVGVVCAILLLIACIGRLRKRFLKNSR